MQKLKTTVLMLCTMVLFAACEKATQIEGAGDTITGTWSWESSGGGVAYQVHTPASTGITKQLKLAADGHYSFFINNSPTASGTYTLEDKNCIHTGKPKKWIRFSAHPEENRMIESVSAHQLQLSDEAYDGFTAKYTRTSKKWD